MEFGTKDFWILLCTHPFKAMPVQIAFHPFSKNQKVQNGEKEPLKEPLDEPLEMGD